ncbi:MAG: DUF1501 domain-containing protein [Planctomyces sp.]|nr:DUF1501 domain-containing protein [Planctomyces sp.]
MNSSMNSIARRFFLGECAAVPGLAALSELLSRRTYAATPVSSARYAQGGAVASEVESLSVRASHFPGRAKAMIHLFMAGAPSQLELFDNKPMLTEYSGKPLPASVIGGQRYAFIQPDAAVMGPQFAFQKHGSSGTEISDALPGLSRIADDVCLIRSMHTDQFNHAPAQILMTSGFSQPGRPCLGSWLLYGLGSETQDLPAFVVMSTGDGISGGTALWSSGFLPTVYNGVQFRNQGPPILNVNRPAGVSEGLEQETFRLVNGLNRRRFEMIEDPEIATRIASFEMAARLQTSAPELMDLSSETAETLELYGCEPEKPSFARACLLARRMVERGVRYVCIFHSGWDAHSNVKGNVQANARVTDQASAALVSDLKRLGMLDETLVLWGGEFGRTPMVESNAALGRALGRDHHPQAFTVWMAGGGIRSGMTLGATDDFGFHVIDQPVHIYDLQATVMHCMGLDHERLTFHHAGRDFRLTDVHGRVIEQILV